QFSDHQSSSMVWSETITFQLLTNDYFATFTPKKIADAHATSEVLLALSRGSREEVDAIVEAAATTGGKADVRTPQDMGWLYSRAFEDPDGHVFEAISADMEAAPAEMGE
ncbi:VOC family protein, partial [Rhizobiaceae sp. 2RAB30]